MTRKQSRLGFYLEIEISPPPSADLEFSFRRFLPRVANSTFSLPMYGRGEERAGIGKTSATYETLKNFREVIPEVMAQSTPDKSERWPRSRADRRIFWDTLFFSGHTRAYHARVHAAAAAGKAAGRLGDRVYVGKEGGWLESKVEVRHSRRE